MTEARAWPLAPRLGAGRAALLVAAALAAVAWPLATYTLSLATFGVAHVLCELRYVDLRFGARLGHRLRAALVATLLVVVVGRLARRDGYLLPSTSTVLELGLGVVLIALVMPTLWRGRRALAGLVLGGALVAGAALAPVTTLLVVAVTHNLTPLGFLADATTGAARRRTMTIALVVFVGVPALVVSGLPFDLLARVGLPAPEHDVLGAGPLVRHFRAYLPDAALAYPWAFHAFAACVFLQCAHYLYVIDVLPRSLPTDARGTVRWPRGALALAALVAVSALVLLGFSRDFADARARYGALAALHAWLEVPILLLALVPTTTPRRIA